jgi:hypothetical protein
MGTENIRQDGSPPDKLPGYVIDHLAQALRNRLRDTLLAPFPEAIEGLLVDLGEDEPVSEQGRGVTGGCAEGIG